MIRCARRWALALAAASACAPLPITLPAGAGQPWPTFEAAFEEAIAPCRSLRSLAAELDLAGRVGRARVRGKVHAGFARPDAARLEGVAPFGAPLFVLAASGAEATLWLPRDRVVVRAAPRALLETLIGLPLEVADLMALVAGCAVFDPRPERAERYADGRAAVMVRDKGTVYVQLGAGGPRIIGVRRGSLAVEYDVPGESGARRLRLVQAGPGVSPIDLRVRMSQLEIDPDLGPEVFTIEVPPDARPQTLDELRRANLFGGSR